MTLIIKNDFILIRRMEYYRKNIVETVSLIGKYIYLKCWHSEYLKFSSYNIN